VDLLLEEVRSLRRQVGGLGETTAAVVERLDETRETRGFSLPDAANIIRGRLTRLTNLFRRGQPRSVEAEPRGEQMPDAQTFRQAWGKFATGVSVITTVHADGEVHGMTANGINSVSLDPLLVLVCAGHTTTSYPMIKETQRFAINILAEEQQPIAEYYARPTDQKTGDLAVSFSRTDRGAATVDGSLAHMDCKVVTEHVAGDHTIFIAEVEEIEVGDGRPLLYFEGRFSQLAGE
jgi:flavin reductase (DIM6/NTAB) family NADH-FMN oxidoreductase RutF